jgi:serine/threonine protein kinase
VQLNVEMRAGMNRLDQYDVTADPEIGGDELPAGTQLSQGNYTIVKHLRSGGFGITYLAHDTLGRKVVIKECFPSGICMRSSRLVRARSRSYSSSVPSLIEKFVGEAQSLARVSHPNIVKVHQVFKENDTAYMALDYVEGHDLVEVMAVPSLALAPNDIRATLMKLLDAIGLVHDTGILHRDISPDNILIDAKRSPILIDFGAARETGISADRAASTLHVVKDGYSPQELYMAGGDQGPWSDLYSLAASFYHVITGVAPPNSQARLSALAMNETDPYVRLTGRTSGYGPTFLLALDKAMSVLPKERMQSARQWIDAIADGEADNVLRMPQADARRPITPMSRITKLEADAARKPISPLILVGAAAAVGVVAVGVFFAMPRSSTAPVARVTAEAAAAPKPTEAAAPPEVAAAKPVAVNPKPVETPAVVSAEVTAAPATVVGTAAAEPLNATWTVQLPFMAAQDQPSFIDAANGKVPGWVAPGVQIVAVDGTDIAAISDIAGVVQRSLDPGEAPAVTVTLTTIATAGADPVDHTIELPVVHEVALRTGAKFFVHQVNGLWQTDVVGLPSGYSGEMRTGDVVAGQVDSGIMLDGPNDLEQVLETAIASRSDATTLAVNRGGDMWVVSLPLPK